MHKRSIRLRAVSAAVFLLAALAVPTVTFVGLAPPVSAASHTCFLGDEATIVGTPGDDRIVGTAGHDVIVALGGNDTILGEGGADELCGNGGNDRISSGPRDAALVGGAGDDRLIGGPGFNDFAPGPGDDQVVGLADAGNYVAFDDAIHPMYVNLRTGVARGQGDDTLVNVQGSQTGPYDDTLIGTDGDNSMKGHAGDDLLIGDGGNDTLAGQGGDDAVRGGAGFDMSDYFDGNYDDGLSTAGPISVNLLTGVATGDGDDTLRGIEGATGSSGADTMIGDDRDNAFFELWQGGDTVQSGGGDDFIATGSGADVVDGGAGADFWYLPDGGIDDPRTTGITVDLAAGTTSDGDTLTSVEDVFGTGYADVVTGDGRGNGLFGSYGKDDIVGGGGNDFIEPGAGRDTADGGPGSDILANLDRAGVTVDLGAGTDSDGGTLTGFEDILGSASDDTLIGDAAPNTILGADGDDVVKGRAGDDLLSGDGGDDTANGGSGTDRCQAEIQSRCEFGWLSAATARRTEAPTIAGAESARWIGRSGVAVRSFVSWQTRHPR
jgi:Ca2+-binding RTX toxin-like protein